MAATDPQELIAQMPPGAAIPCRTWRPGPHTDFLVREDSEIVDGLTDSVIELRHGLFLSEEVVLVPVMFRMGPHDDQLFETWLNFHDGREGPQHFRDLSNQEDICFHLYGDSRTREKTLTIFNSSKNFFRKAISIIVHIDPWTPREFDRARAQIYDRHPSAVSLWSRLGIEERPAS
jgi:hypothetical protein